MKTAHIWLLPLAVTLLTAPLTAQYFDAPRPLWHSAATVPTATVNWPRLTEDAQEAAHEAAQQASQTPPATPPESAAPKPQATTAPEKSTDEPQPHKRGFRLAPRFTVVNDASKARPLSVGEKWKVFYRQTYEPYRFLTAGIGAGISQARDEIPAYGQGMEGYAKRYGAGYADNNLGSFFGNFALPSLLHDDPRYFSKGSGPFTRRLLHAAGGAVITRRDNGTSRPNYSNIFGNLIGCAIGNVYYPQSERNVGDTVARGLEVTAFGAIGNILQEFWPGVQKKVFQRHHKLADVK